jgi:hypothetical protein
MKRRGAGILEKGVKITMLTAQGRPCREESLDESTALGAIAAETAFAHKHGKPDCAFCGVVGRLNALDVDKPVLFTRGVR